MSKGTVTPSYRQRLSYHAMLLAGMCLLAAMVLVIADVETRDSIAAAKKADQKASLEQVIPPDLYDNDILQDIVVVPIAERADGSDAVTVYLARQGEQVVAAAFEMADFGYSGLITVMLGLDTEGAILGARVLSHTETPGLGDKIEVARDDWILGFNGLSLAIGEDQWAVKKDGGQFDQFSGATITPRTVVKVIKESLLFFKAHQAQLIAQPPPAVEMVDAVATPST